MDCSIIFYMARKTNLCEKNFTISAKKMQLNVAKTFFATSPPQFGETMITALSECNIIFTIGGLSNFGDASVENILSNALSLNKPDDAKKLGNADIEDKGYIIRKDNQVIIVLPDEPDSINSLMNKEIENYIKKHCITN